jgi:hypothetical protein
LSLLVISSTLVAWMLKVQLAVLIGLSHAPNHSVNIVLQDGAHLKYQGFKWGQKSLGGLLELAHHHQKY